MQTCINCGTNQVQRIRDGYWRVLCRCRRCGFKHFDSLNSKEWEVKREFRESGMLNDMLNALADIDLDDVFEG